MFVVTLNKKTVKKLFIGLGCAVVMGIITFAVATIAGQTTEAAAQGNVVKSTEDMASYLLGYGIDANIGTANVAKVSIPKKWDEDFKAFNEVLVKSGFDLSKLKGKNVDKWVMEATNKSQNEQVAYAVLLVRDDKVVGGYLMYQPSGEVMPLKDSAPVPSQVPDAQNTQTEQAQQASTENIEGEITAEILPE